MIDNDTSLLDKNREPVDSFSTNDLVPTTEQVHDDTSCQHDSHEIHSIGGSTSPSTSLLVSLNSDDAHNGFVGLG